LRFAPSPAPFHGFAGWDEPQGDTHQRDDQPLRKVARLRSGELLRSFVLPHCVPLRE
jgi:hypothetical protein